MSAQYAVEVRGVHKSFGTLEVLRGIDLLIRRGEVTVILGPSGSGKSTLLRTLNHLEKVDRGLIQVAVNRSGTASRAPSCTNSASGRSCSNAPESASSSRTSTCSPI